LESGHVQLHEIRDLLGHKSIAQTDTYLATSAKTQHDAMRRFDEARAAETVGDDSIASSADDRSKMRAQPTLFDTIHVAE
jgi:hypothetical protein